MEKFTSAILVMVLSHIFEMGERHALPAKTVNSKMFCNYGLYMKNDNGEKEMQQYHLYKEEHRFLITTSKRTFDIMIDLNKEEYSKKEMKVIEDFIMKSIG